MTAIKKGTIITAKHIETGNIREYKIVVERLDKDYYRLLNLQSNMIMSAFKTTDTMDTIKYIEGLGNGQEIISYK